MKEYNEPKEHNVNIANDLNVIHKTIQELEYGYIEKRDITRLHVKCERNKRLEFRNMPGLYLGITHTPTIEWEWIPEWKEMKE